MALVDFLQTGANMSRFSDADRPTPAPWINVIANPSFGFQCAADGGGYTWFGNSRENQITGWSNDPVSNRLSEAIYVQDKKDGLLISPTLAPLKSSDGTHLARHGFGYSVFERDTHKLRMELLQTRAVGGLRQTVQTETDQ